MSEPTEHTDLSAEQRARAEALRVARAALLNTGVFVSTLPDVSAVLAAADWVLDGRLDERAKAARITLTDVDGTQSGSAPLSEPLDGVSKVHDRIGEVADRSDDCLEKVALAINLGIKNAFDRHDRLRLEREERAAREGDAVGDVVVDGHEDSSSRGEGQPVRAAEDSLDRTLDGTADTGASSPAGGGAAASDCAAAPEGGEES